MMAQQRMACTTTEYVIRSVLQKATEKRRNCLPSPMKRLVLQHKDGVGGVGWGVGVGGGGVCGKTKISTSHLTIDRPVSKRQEKSAD